MCGILDLLKQDGLDPKWVASTDGGEFASLCPGCGGEDRFRSWPKKGKGGRFWCRRCGKSGDLIAYLMEFRGMSYKESCHFLKLPMKPLASDFSNLGSTNLSNQPPFQIEPPPPKWQEIVQGIVEQSVKCLKSSRFKHVREWLKARGLKPETVERRSLGWNKTGFLYQRKNLGLEEEISNHGKTSKVWIPEGLAIPCYRDGLIQKVSVRRSKKGNLNEPPDDGSRYVIVSGSSARVNMMLGTSKEYVIVVESDLDALLINQLAGDIVSVIAMGSAANKPDYEAAKLLKKARVVLISLDHDDAGINATDWWLSGFLNTKRWPVLKCKDPGEAYQRGVNLRSWVRAGLPDDVVCLEDLVAPDNEQLSIEDILDGAF
jgi:hypothetical protein